MIDYSHIVGQYGSNVQVFGANSAAAGVTWQSWIKPRGISMVQILLLGGGGGASVAGAASTAAGGGGGGSSAQSIALFPAAFLPDVLSISVGVGGAGGSGGSGGSGIASYVSVIENTTVNHLLMQATGGTGGGDGICVIICW